MLNPGTQDVPRFDFRAAMEEQSVAALACNASAQAKGFEVEIDVERRRRLRGEKRGEALMELFHPCGSALIVGLADGTKRKTSTGKGEGSNVVRVLFGKAASEKFLPELMVGEGVERERFALGEFLGFIGQLKAQAAREEEPGGISQERSKIVQGKLTKFSLRFIEGLLDEGRRSRAGGTDGSAGAAVFLRVTEEAAPRLEVFFAESLEAVTDEDAGENAAAIICLLKLEALHDAVHEFAEQDGGRGFAVVADALANVAEMKTVAGREQGFEEEIAVVLTGGAVAETGLRGHEIEAEMLGGTGERAVVHADQADNLERDAAHRLEAAKGDAAREEAGVVNVLFERGDEAFEHGGEFDGLIESRESLVPAKSRELVTDGLEFERGVLGGLEEIAEQAAERFGPVVERTLLLKQPDGGDDALDEFDETSKDGGGAALDVVAGQDALEDAFAESRHGVAEEQAVQTGTPGVSGERGKFQLSAMCGIDAPADVGLVDP